MNSNLIKELLNYNPDDGLFRWKISPNRCRPVGTIVGSKDKDGYLYSKIQGKHYKLHRLAFLFMLDRYPLDQVDHINGDKSDNRFCNLRECNGFQNHHNTKLPSNNKSGIKGVSWSITKNKWQAVIQVNNKRIFLGYFDDITEAKNVIDNRRIELHSEFARHE